MRYYGKFRLLIIDVKSARVKTDFTATDCSSRKYLGIMRKFVAFCDRLYLAILPKI